MFSIVYFLRLIFKKYTCTCKNALEETVKLYEKMFMKDMLNDS